MSDSVSTELLSCVMSVCKTMLQSVCPCLIADASVLGLVVFSGVPNSQVRRTLVLKIGLLTWS